MGAKCFLIESIFSLDPYDGAPKVAHYSGTLSGLEKIVGEEVRSGSFRGYWCFWYNDVQ